MCSPERVPQQKHCRLFGMLKENGTAEWGKITTSNHARCQSQMEMDKPKYGAHASSIVEHLFSTSATWQRWMAGECEKEPI